MILKINLQQDEELRAYIKDLIKGQVISLARKEIKKMISELVDKKFIPKTQLEIDRIINRHIREQADNIISPYYEYKKRFDAIFERLAVQKVKKELREIEINKQKTLLKGKK